MHARFVRSAAVAVAVTGTLTWAPAASAQPSEPTPSASAETPAPDAGSVEITTKDTAGDALPSAAFLLLDSAGQEAGRGKTDAQGKLTFSALGRASTASKKSPAAAAFTTPPMTKTSSSPRATPPGSRSSTRSRPPRSC